MNIFLFHYASPSVFLDIWFFIISPFQFFRASNSKILFFSFWACLCFSEFFSQYFFFQTFQTNVFSLPAQTSGESDSRKLVKIQNEDDVAKNWGWRRLVNLQSIRDGKSKFYIPIDFKFLRVRVKFSHTASQILCPVSSKVVGHI